MTEWISITKKLPPLNKKVWCYAKNDNYRRGSGAYFQLEATRVKTDWLTDSIVFDDTNANKYWIDSITHWQKLPKSPKRDERGS